VSIKGFFFKGGIKVKKDKMTCSDCGKEKIITKDFYTSFSPFHKSTGRLHVCKQCVQDSVKDGDIESFKNFCRSFDKPFITHLYESAITNNAYIGEYFKLINAKDFKHMTWNDSDFDGHKNSKSIKTKISIEDVENDDIRLDKNDLKELINFFGKGFDVEDYVWLQGEYEDFLNRYECDSKGMELLIKEICLQQLDIQKRRAVGEKVDQQLKTLQDLLGSSNLKPVQETGANAVEQESFGTLIKKYERERPIPEPDPMWKDVDGIGKYIKTFFFGHMARALGIENKSQDEYDEEIKKYTVEHVVENEDGELDG
jgi:hypothetical protein